MRGRDGYKIVNINKYSPTPPRDLDLPVFPHPCLYAGDLYCRHVDCDYNNNSPHVNCLVGWTNINGLALLCNVKDATSFYSGSWNTDNNPDLAFASVGLNSCLPIRCVLERFTDHNIDLRLLHHQGLLWLCQACLLSDGTSARPNGVIILL